MRSARILLIVFVVTACADDGNPTDVSLDAGIWSCPEIAVDESLGDAGIWSCPEIAVAESRGNLQYTDLKEISGLAVSRRHPGVLWGHNDSGDTPRIFALILPEEGGEEPVESVEFTLNHEMVNWGDVDSSWEKMADDYEDMAIGPFAGFDNDAIFIADVGDNSMSRNSVRLYVFEEPEQLTAGDISDVRFFDVVYEDGPRDCESVFVDPLTGDVYLVEKEYAEAVADVYRIEAAELDGQHESPLTAVSIGQVAVAIATAADMSADGTLLAIRNYSGFDEPTLNGLIFRRDASMTITELLAEPACPLPNFVAEPAYEIQGETIAFAPDNSGVYSASERIFDLQSVHFWKF